MIILWGLAIVGAIYLVKLVAGGVRGGEAKETAMDILRKRYARGEITKEEFEKMKGDLTRG